MHHIRQWAVYRVHDTEHMIAVCPSCHDAIHNGALPISNETLYRWKGLRRDSRSRTVVITPEPGADPGVFIGNMRLTTTDRDVRIFKFRGGSELRYRLLDGDIVQVNSRITDVHGDEVLRIVDNHVRYQAVPALEVLVVPGHVTVTSAPNEDCLPGWAIDQIRWFEPSFGRSGPLVMLDLEVIRPGLLQLQGVWPAREGVCVVTANHWFMMHGASYQPFCFGGSGEETVMMSDAPSEDGLIQFGPKPD